MNRDRLNLLRDEYREKLKIRTDSNYQGIEKQILVCGGTGCTSNHSKEIIEEINRLIEEKNLNNVRVIRTGCFGLCAKGPIIIIRPSDTFYSLAKKEDMAEIIEEDIINNKVVERLLCKDIDNNLVKKLDELSFYKKQKRIVLKNCGLIDPENILEYIGCDGYQALAKVLFEMEPLSVIEEIKNSNLRGRGGAGFKTGLKWEMGAKSENEIKYVACNADEGDPGAFMDRSVLEGDPHRILEAMAVAGYAIGANRGFVYIRAEYPIAVERLKIAIKQAHEYGLLGENILGSDFSFDVEIRLGAGAFVCGEETALIASVEGERGEPRLRPPYPTTSGIFEKPTVLNNVETYANIAPIILNGSDWFNSIGTTNNSGTKVFALGGKINNTGLIEVPMGTTLREIIYDIGGGIPDNTAFKMAQTGGPSGGCIPADLIDTPMDYESLKEIGSMMGSGGLIVMDEDSCAVDIASFFLEFTVDESCGKCTPCRLGTKKMYDMLQMIKRGEAVDLTELEELANYIKDTSLCGLGQSAPNPVLSTLKYYKNEYLEHINNKKCPAHVCANLIHYEILEDKCVGCTLCKRNCAVNAITGEVKTPHKIDKDKCVKCGVCYNNCRFKAIVKK